MKAEPMELHDRDCVDTAQDGHVPNGLNRYCRCTCHRYYEPKGDEDHWFLLVIPERREWRNVRERRQDRT